MIDSVAQPWFLLLLLLVPFVFVRAVRSYADRAPKAKLGIALIRSVICVLLVFELARITFWWRGKSGPEHTAYLVDVSESITPAMRQGALDQLLEAAENTKDRERASLIFFGASPFVAIPFGEGLTPEKVTEAFEPFLAEEAPETKFSPKNTNLERVLQITLAAFPAEAQRKVVLITDGNQTDGNALKQAGAASEQQAQVCVVPLEEEDCEDVAVVALNVPERIKRDEAFEIRCDVRSAAEKAEGSLKLFVDDYLAEEKEVSLTRGRNSTTFRRRLEEGGHHLLQVHFESEAKQPTENDKAFEYISLPGRPRVLIISTSDVAPLATVLRESRLLVDRVTPAGAPTTMLELIRYEAVILGNVAADELGKLRLRLLRDYVARFGGGLVLTGGHDSFGPGGYVGTPVEEASPVAMEVPPEQRPSTSVILLVDDSRSMWLHGTSDLKFEKELFTKPGAAYTGLSTQDKANFIKEVFRRVVVSLSDRDRIGVLGLTSQLKAAEWYVRPQRVTDQVRLVEQFNRAFKRQRYSILIDSVDEARFFLGNDPATYKQVVLFTDGYVAADEDYYKLAQIFLSDGFSLSTVGVGRDSNVRLLDELARWGGGRFFLAEDLKKIGDVYEKELTAPATQLLVQRATPISLIKDTEMLKGLDMNLAPDLFGYVRTRPRTSAKMFLAAEGTQDPILACWQYQAGKVAAFTSSAVGSWATLWVKDWENGYRRFWRQLVGGVFRERGQETYRVRLKPDGVKLKVIADVVDANENFVNGTSVAAQLYYLGERGDVFSPSVSWSAPLGQVAPGRYEHEFEMEDAGVYLATVKGTRPEAGAIATSGAIIPTPKEHMNPGANQRLIAAVAEATGGVVSGTARDAAEAKGVKERRRHDLGYVAVILAALLLVLEVIVRRWPAIVEFRRSRLASKAEA